jgi:hypothetical protein
MMRETLEDIIKNNSDTNRKSPEPNMGSGVFERIYNDILKKIESKIESIIEEKFDEKAMELNDMFDSVVPAIVENLKEAKGEKGDPGDDGEDGFTPEKGVDYFDGEPGYTPVKGLDYFTEQEKRQFLEEATPIKGLHYFTEKEISDFLKKITPKKGIDYFDGKNTELKAEVIRDLLMTLKGNNRLPASAIKDLPQEDKPLFEKRLGRGTGSPTMYYDLSSQCDGSTKVFTIPANTRVIGVHGTQFPINYRPLVDWTTSGTGNVTLTLSSEVSAPETGQTLWITYVE